MLLSISTSVCFIFLVASLWVSSQFNKKTKLFNPLVVYFGIWFFCLALYELDGYFGYFLKLDQQADKWLGISFLCFFVGGLVPFFLNRRTVATTITIGKFESDYIWRISQLLFVFFLLAVTWKYFILFKVYGNFLSSFIKIREDAYDGRLVYPSFLYFFTLPAYLLIINLGILTIINKRKAVVILGILTLILSFFNASSVGMRGGFFNFFLLFVFSIIAAYLASGKAIRVKHYLFLSIAMISGIFLLSLPTYLRSGVNDLRQDRLATIIEKLEMEQFDLFKGLNDKFNQKIDFNFNKPNVLNNKNEHLENKLDVSDSKHEILKSQTDESKFNIQAILEDINAKSSLLNKDIIPITSIGGIKILEDKIPFSMAFFYHSFLYIVGPIPSYSYFLKYPWHKDYWGMWTFSGIYQGINVLTNLIGSPVFQDINARLVTYYAPITKLGPFNCTNYLTYIFSDFGYKGLMIFPFLFGLISNYFFLRSIKYKKIIDIQLSALLFLGLILSIRGVLTAGLFCWVLILLILIQGWFLKILKFKVI